MSVALVSSSTTITPPILKPTEYTMTDLISAFFKERVKDIAKIGAYLAYWTTEAIPNLPPNVTKFNSVLKEFKNFVSATEVPEKLQTWGGSVTAFVANLSGETMEKVGTAARKVFKDTMSLLGSATDGIDFASLFIPMCKETLRWVSGISLVATLGGAGNGAIEQLQNINGMDKIDPKRTTFYLINLARDVSYIALGIIGFSFFFAVTPTVPWMIVACATSGLAFSIGGYFYERIVDPENKGKNLNPAIVVENHVNQRNYEQRLAESVTE